MKNIFRLLLIICLSYLSLAANISFAFEFDIKESDKKGEVLIRSDIVSYDNNNKIITSEGNVEVIDGNRVINANKLIYDQQNEKLIAEGNVIIKDNATGSIITADKFDLSRDFSKGSIMNFEAKTLDNNTFKALSATKDGNITKMQEASYTPCKICVDKKTGKEKPPLWQINAQEIKFDENKETIYYKNAFIVVYGTPVIYVPYFFHPSPDAKRRTGFLAPSYQSKSDIGNMVSIPYYVNIDTDKDITITPTISDTGNNIIAGEYRQLFSDKNQIDLSGSITKATGFDDESGQEKYNGDYRYYGKADGKFDLGYNWKASLLGERVSDDSYLDRYEGDGRKYLTSQANIYNLLDGDDGYFDLSSLYFQEIDPNTTDNPDLYVPLKLSGYYQSNISSINSIFNLNYDVRNIAHQNGNESSLTSLKTGLNKNYNFSGTVIDTEVSLRGDVYSFDKKENLVTNANEEVDGADARIIPQIVMDVKHPLIRRGEDYNVTITPRAQFIASPNDSNSDNITNEDSLYSEISYLNLFSDNHFAGLDRVEEGGRVNYGISSSVASLDGKKTFSFGVGQNYRSQEHQDFDINSGLDDNFSDIVMMTGFDYNDFFTLIYQNRLKQDSMERFQDQIITNLDFGKISFMVDYINRDDNSLTGDDKMEQIALSSDILVNDNLSLFLGSRYDLLENNSISYFANAIYYFDCIGISVTGQRRFTSNSETDASTSIGFNIIIKNFMKDKQKDSLNSNTKNNYNNNVEFFRE